MTEEQLQLLRASRLSGEDENDIAIKLAREALRGNDESSKQLSLEHQVDLRLQQGLRDIAIPETLESGVFAAMRAALDVKNHTSENQNQLEEPLHVEPMVPMKPQSRRRFLAWALPAAASVALGLGWMWQRRNTTSLVSLAKKLAKISSDGIKLTLMSMDRQQVTAWLNDKRAPRPDQLPQRLDLLVRKGCHIYQIDGCEVSLECFLLPDMKQLHLFCIESANLSDPPNPLAAPSISALDEFTLAIWSRDQVTMLFLSHEPAEKIRELLS